MKLVFISNDGNQFEKKKDALVRDIALELKNCFNKFLWSDDAKNLEDFIADTSRVHALISGMLSAVAAKSELDKVE